MKFINEGGPMKFRVGNTNECYWKTIRNNEIIDLSLKEGKAIGLKIFTVPGTVKTTEGQIGNKKVETKQISVPQKEVQNVQDKVRFFRELQKINGIGKKTAEDIIGIFKTKEELIRHVQEDDELPLRDDVEIKLREKYGI